ncbi:hypothetical protein NP493_258g06009 [Ridgeia piscesae]|uniref:Uncharacterized protein n=1 Tax=Ridgeia piscesae TaxID=27915 RepID=A0AAD9UCR4_RIDPI|nr:hypothetical protein NP493_258g06009 [Ridgeia piscesae]
MALGRDIGKLKKEGFLRGTQARRISIFAIFGVLGWSTVYTIYKVCTVDWNTHWANRLIQRMDQRFADRQDQVKSIELRKKYAVAHKTTSSDTPWDY